MSVTSVSPVDFRSYRGGGLLPVQRFLARGDPGGNATGGTVTIQVALRPTSVVSPPSGLIYGLEDVWVQSSVAAARWSWFSVNLDLMGIPNVPVSGDGMEMPIVTHPRRGLTGMTGYIRPYALVGREIDIQSASVEIRVVCDTNTNGAAYMMYVRGWIWEPQAFYNGGPLWPSAPPLGTIGT